MPLPHNSCIHHSHIFRDMWILLTVTHVPTLKWSTAYRLVVFLLIITQHVQYSTHCCWTYLTVAANHDMSQNTNQYLSYIHINRNTNADKVQCTLEHPQVANHKSIFETRVMNTIFIKSTTPVNNRALRYTVDALNTASEGRKQDGRKR
jgi:hypothetical protein